MSKRIDKAVTLSHAEGEEVARYLGDYASRQADHATKSRSAAVRQACASDAVRMRELASRINSNLWEWID